MKIFLSLKSWSISSRLLAVLCLGISCQVSQVLLLRELLMVFYGNELSIGIILAAWMVWVAVGSWTGGVLGDKVRCPLLFVAIGAVAQLLVLPCTIFMTRIFRGFLGVGTGEYVSFFDTIWSCFLLLGPNCVLLGFQFVLLSKVWRQLSGTADTSGAAKVYVFESLGSVIGGLAFTFIMVRLLNPFESAFAVGALSLGAVFALCRRLAAEFHHVRSIISATLLISIIAILISFPFLGRFDELSIRIQWRNFNSELEFVESRESKYGRITVLRDLDQYNFFRSGYLSFSMAGAQEEKVGFEEQSAVIFANFSLVQHTNPKNILLVGGGLRGVLREVAKHAVESIDYVELDPLLVETAKKYATSDTLAALRDPRVQVLNTDGRLYVKSSDKKYDMILISLPDPSTAVVNRFYTVEFFREAKKRLRPNGVLVTGVVSAQNMRGQVLVNRNATMFHTLRAVFLRVLAVGEAYCYFFATDSDENLSADHEVLRRRFLKRGVETEGFSQWYYFSLLQQSPLRRVNWILRHRGRKPDSYLKSPEVPQLPFPSFEEQIAEEDILPPVDEKHFINSDLQPIGYFYTQAFLDLLSKAVQDTQSKLNYALRIQPWWILPVMACAFGTGLFLFLVGKLTDRGPHRYYAILLAIFTTGLSTMTFEVALIFSFQNVYGFVYEMIGLIVAIFMAGLAVGSAFTNKFIRRKENTDLLALIEFLVAGFACLMAYLIFSSHDMKSATWIFVIYCVITFMAGVFDGADFPLATACYMALNKNAERATGIIYGVELVGGCIGAVITSAVLVPILGIVPSCLFAGIMNAVAGVVLLISRR